MDLKLVLLVNRKTFTVGFETGQLEDDETEVVELHAQVGFAPEERDEED